MKNEKCKEKIMSIQEWWIDRYKLDWINPNETESIKIDNNEPDQL